MASFTITTLNDIVDGGDGRLSLREAVRRANGTAAADSIAFADRLDGGVLVLRGGQLDVRRDLRIEGDADGDSFGVTIDGADRSRVFEIGGARTDVRLDGLTITNAYSGFGEGYSAETNGGAVLLGAGASLDIVGCRIEGNRAGGYYAGYGNGGGVFAARDTSLTIADSVVAGNRGSNGGGIYAREGSEVRIERSLLEGNTGAGYRFGDGGGLFVRGATASISDSTIAGNNADGEGGGIFASRSRVTLTDSTVAGNLGTYRLGYGSGAGIYATKASDVRLEGSTVTGNLLAQSDYSFGAGISVDAPDRYTGASRLSLSNSIVAGNFELGDDRVASDIDGTITASNGHNIFGSAVDGEAAGDREGVAALRIFAGIDAVTGGGQLALNGGPTPTVALRDGPNNPALGRADPDDADGFDQRGFARPRPDGTDPDIGAFERDQGTGMAARWADGDAYVFDFGRQRGGRGEGGDVARNVEADRVREAPGPEPQPVDQGHRDDVDPHLADKLAQAESDFYL